MSACVPFRTPPPAAEIGRDGVDEVRHDEPLGEREAVADVGEAPPEDGRVARERDGAVAGPLGPIDEGAREVAVAVQVELEPLGGGRGARDVLERRRGERRCDVERAHVGGRARGGRLAFGAGELVVGRGRDQHGEAHVRVEHPRARDRRRHVDERSVADLVARVGVGVPAKGLLVVGAGAVVVVGGGREPPPRGLLEVARRQQFVHRGRKGYFGGGGSGGF
jgi:hypothetical protein